VETQKVNALVTGNSLLEKILHNLSTIPLLVWWAIALWIGWLDRPRK
jgi:hypothetical protein